MKSENENSELNISDVSDSSKSIAVDFAKWIADNKLYICKKITHTPCDK